MFSWLERLKAAKVHARQARPAQPCLEELETRKLLAVSVNQVIVSLLCLLYLFAAGVGFRGPAPAAFAAPPEPLPEDFFKGAPFLRATFSPVGRLLALSGEFHCNSSEAPCGLLLWDLKEDAKKPVIRKDLTLVYALAFSPDGRTFATVHRDSGAVKLWDTASCNKLADLGKGDATGAGAAFSPDGKLLATAWRNGKVVLWDVAGRKAASTLDVSASPLGALAFSPDGKLLATAGSEGKVFLTKVATGEQVGSIGGEEDGFCAVCFSPDGRTIATAGPRPDRVTLWETQTRQRRADLPAHEGMVLCVAFSPDGKRVASGCTKGRLKVWDVSAQKEILSVQLQPSVDSLSFSPDGKVLAAGFGYRQVKLWDMTTGKEHASPKDE